MRTQGSIFGSADHALVRFWLDVDAGLRANIPLCKAEVDDIGLIAFLPLANHQVLWFQISMHKVLLVKELKLVEDLKAYVDCCWDC